MSSEHRDVKDPITFPVGVESPFGPESSQQFNAKEFTNGNLIHNYAPQFDISKYDVSQPVFNDIPTRPVTSNGGMRYDLSMDENKYPSVESFGIEGLVGSHILTEAYTMDVFEKRTIYVAIVVLIVYVLLFVVIRMMIHSDVKKYNTRSSGTRLW